MGTTLEILLHGLPVGHLSADDTGRVSFRLLEEYRRLPQRPVLSQSFEDDLAKVYRGRKGWLPAYFANLVPEGSLRDLIEANLRLPKGDDMALLAAVGQDLPGAVEIRPADVGQGIPDEMTNGEDFQVASPAGPRSEEGDLRFSLAGVQLKFSVLRQGDKLALPMHGSGGEWIVKLDSSSFAQVVENEYAILEWARAAGFEVPECHILPASALPPELRRHADPGRSVLSIRRYDRDGGRRIHQEDFAQVTSRPPRLKYDHVKYEQCALLVRRIVGEEAYFEFIKRLVFVVASGNNDAHLKNWSLIYPDGIRAELSPLYDQVCTIAWPEMPRTLALKLLSIWQLAQVEEATFSRLATQVGADPERTVATVRRTLERIAGTWHLAAGRDVMPREHANALRDYWRTVPLLKRYAAELKIT